MKHKHYEIKIFIADSLTTETLVNKLQKPSNSNHSITSYPFSSERIVYGRSVCNSVI